MLLGFLQGVRNARSILEAGIRSFVPSYCWPRTLFFSQPAAATLLRNVHSSALQTIALVMSPERLPHDGRPPTGEPELPRHVSSWSILVLFIPPRCDIG
eukprot:scaffold28376_cov54-Attheya_sp.AAC.3